MTAQTVYAGIDAGMDYTKAALVKADGSWCGAVVANGLLPAQEAAGQALLQALAKWQLPREAVAGCGVTGMAQNEIGMPAVSQPGFYCTAQGAERLMPGSTLVLDLGSRQTSALLCEHGIVYRRTASEKCASGAGAYLNMVSAFMGLEPVEMNELYFSTDQAVLLETKCAVFAESEIISLVHRRVPKEQIVRGAFIGLASRVHAQTLGLPKTDTVTLTGGGAMLPALTDALQQAFGCRMLVPAEPQLAGALGAALLMQKQKGGAAPC